MPASSRQLSAALGALCGGALAGAATADAHIHRATADLWLAEPLARAGLAIPLAAIAAVLLARVGSRRAAWLVVALAAAVSTLSAWIAVHDPTATAGAWALVVGSAAAGTVLGAVVAATWGEQPNQSALALGVLGCGLIAQPWLVSADHVLAPIWLTVGTVVAATAGAVTADSAYRIPLPNPATVRLALVAAAGLTVLIWLYAAWSHANGRPLTGALPTVALAGLVALVVGTDVARRLAAPTDGAFLPATLATAAGAGPVLASLAMGPDRVAAEWLIVTGVVAVGIGLRVAIVRPLLPVGIGLLALIPLAGLALPEAGHDGPLLAVRVAVVGLGAGLTVASTFPGQAPIAALGFSGAGAVATLCVVLLAAAVPASGYPASTPLQAETAIEDQLLWFDPSDYRVAATAMLLIVGYAAMAILGRPRRT